MVPGCSPSWWKRSGHQELEAAGQHDTFSHVCAQLAFSTVRPVGIPCLGNGVAYCEQTFPPQLT